MVDFDYIYKKYFNYIRTIVYRMIEQDPDDITQMVFYKLSKFTYSEEHAKAFLIRAAKNMSIDYIRKRKRDKKNMNKMRLDLGMFIEPTTQEEQAADLAEIHAGVIDFIYKEIQKLPPGARNVFELYLRGKNIKQIAEELGVAVQTAANQLNTARTRLKIEILFNKKDDALQLLAKRPIL